MTPNPSESAQSTQHSADKYEYVDERGIRIADRDWECPNCGSDGKLMHRPGSKNTCATCFWVQNGRYNDHVLADWPLLHRQGQRLLAANGEPWHGTPGDVGTRLRQIFDTPSEAETAIKRLQTQTTDEQGGERTTRLTDFANEE